ncbi:hypothetical protein ASPTUDRAFT_510590 [Aspergillus tubingensis CBS 134.48]|uniref:Transmembrane protein n=1 Tax=Aspergillus tubingensis (strain CBS 134.48) TaxID=767770 RepID=A0A1L9NCL3_ASPTC|nr:hypothetical protein ASPTUDRAFT_510590 [Aspergillus tubingensis CBS 134.48]
MEGKDEAIWGVDRRVNRGLGGHGEEIFLRVGLLSPSPSVPPSLVILLLLFLSPSLSLFLSPAHSLFYFRIFLSRDSRSRLLRSFTLFPLSLPSFSTGCVEKHPGDAVGDPPLTSVPLFVIYFAAATYDLQRIYNKQPLFPLFRPSGFPRHTISLTLQSHTASSSFSLFPSFNPATCRPSHLP